LALIFWSDVGNATNHAIFRSKMDGTDVKTLINGLNMPASKKEENFRITVKPAHVITSIKQSLVLKADIFLVLS
jgi:hypothetical protein